MKNQLTGHITNHGTLRFSSVGDIYPYVIVIKGTKETSRKFHVIGNGLKLEDLVLGSYSEAEQEAQKLLV